MMARLEGAGAHALSASARSHTRILHSRAHTVATPDESQNINVPNVTPDAETVCVDAQVAAMMLARCCMHGLTPDPGSHADL